MDEIHGRASLQVDATPQAVFDLITDVGRLPEWNVAIETVLERPPALAEGAEWTVKMHPPRTPSWTSISRLEELDRRRFRFAYETRNGDGNPSRARWAWEVTGAPGGAEVTVRWERLPQDGRPQVLRRPAPQAPAGTRSAQLARRDGRGSDGDRAPADTG